nr:hypothetical protein [Tanacetum cinerariifolium]
MTIETHNWASSAHQEFHKIVREEIFPIVNQVDARVQNFEIQFLKEAAKFVGDFKSLTKEADASLAKYKILELEIERLLKAVVSQDIISVVQNASVVDTSDLQTELERTKERFENCIIKKETEYAKLWNDWYKKFTSNSVSTPPVSKGVNNDKVITPGMFRISPDKISREAKKRVDNTTKTRRTQLKRSSKNNKVPYVVKSSYKKNKAADVEENHRNLLSSSNKKHVSSACNKFMLDSQNVYSKVVCAMCKQCLISVNHDDCLLKYVKDKDSR